LNGAKVLFRALLPILPDHQHCRERKPKSHFYPARSISRSTTCSYLQS
jgi:hypothetical protein